MKEELWCESALFDGEWCDRAMSLLDNPTEGLTFGGKDEKRVSDVQFLERGEPNHQFLFDAIDPVVDRVNRDIFSFDIYPNGLWFLQLGRYSPGGKYDSHMDSYLCDAPGNGSYDRKLSFTIQLSDPSWYEGGDMIFDDVGSSHDDMVKRRERGAIILFPSFLSHSVAPVTNGTRYSLVGWVMGNAWR